METKTQGGGPRSARTGAGVLLMFAFAMMASLVAMAPQADATEVKVVTLQMNAPRSCVNPYWQETTGQAVTYGNQNAVSTTVELTQSVEYEFLGTCDGQFNILIQVSGPIPDFQLPEYIEEYHEFPPEPPCVCFSDDWKQLVTNPLEHEANPGRGGEFGSIGDLGQSVINGAMTAGAEIAAIAEVGAVQRTN